MIDQLHGRLTVLAAADTEINGSLRWLCQCACLRYVIVRGANLRGAKTKSCGCLRRELCRARAIVRNQRPRAARMEMA